MCPILLVLSILHFIDQHAFRAVASPRSAFIVVSGSLTLSYVRVLQVGPNTGLKEVKKSGRSLAGQQELW